MSDAQGRLDAAGFEQLEATAAASVTPGGAAGGAAGGTLGCELRPRPGSRTVIAYRTARRSTGYHHCHRSR